MGMDIYFYKLNKDEVKKYIRDEKCDNRLVHNVDGIDVALSTQFLDMSSFPTYEEFEKLLTVVGYLRNNHVAQIILDTLVGGASQAITYLINELQYKSLMETLDDLINVPVSEIDNEKSAELSYLTKLKKVLEDSWKSFDHQTELLGFSWS